MSQKKRISPHQNVAIREYAREKLRCPTCRAKPGNHCVRITGKAYSGRKGYVHDARSIMLRLIWNDGYNWGRHTSQLITKKKES